MADSAALRQQRRRHHQAGDHSLCTSRCEAARPSLKIAPLPDGTGEFLDPAAALAELAQGLMAACRADPTNAVLAKECRQTLLVLPGARGDGVEAEWSALIRGLSVPAEAESPFPAGWRGTEVDGPLGDAG